MKVKVAQELSKAHPALPGYSCLSSASLTLRESDDHLFPITDSQPRAHRIGSENANNEKSHDSGWNALNFGPRAVALRKVCSEDK